MIEIKYGQKAIVKSSEGHFFQPGSEITFKGMDTINGEEVYIFSGKSMLQSGVIISQELFEQDFQLIDA